MKKLDLELMVGFFIVAGIVCLGYLSIRLGKLEIRGERGYEIHATFSNVGGLKVGSPIVIAGVDVGRVKSVTMQNYQALVILTLPEAIKIQEDSIALIKTKGLIGEKYIEITPGGSEKVIPRGGRIQETQSAVDLEELISKITLGKL